MKYVIIADLAPPAADAVIEALAAQGLPVETVFSSTDMCVLSVTAVEQPAPAQEQPAEPVAAVEPVPAEVPMAPTLELPMETAEEVQPVEAIIPAPEFPFSEACIVNMDSTHSIPTSFDASRACSVLRVVGTVTENAERHTLSFTLGTSSFSVPILAYNNGLIENVGAWPEATAVRALIRLGSNLHGVRLVIEVADDGKEQIIFGSDMTHLTTSHEEKQDAGVS